VERDILIVYFSGHGILDEGGLYLTFKDTRGDALTTTAFNSRKFIDVLIERGLQHMLLILDCCYSGASGKSLGLSAADESKLELLLSDERENLTVLAASASRQVALESEQHGLFTKALLDAAQSLQSTSPIVTVAGLYTAAFQLLIDNPFGQRCWKFSGAAGGALPLLLTAPKQLDGNKLLGAVQTAMQRGTEWDDKILTALLEIVRSGGMASGDTIEHGRYFQLKRSEIMSVLAKLGGVCLGLAMFVGSGAALFEGHILGGLVAIVISALLMAAILFDDAAIGLVLSREGVIRVGAKHHSAYSGLSIESVDVMGGTEFMDQSGGDLRLVLKLRNGDRVKLARSSQRWTVGFDHILGSIKLCERIWQERYAQIIADEATRQS
jgi:hypothetical protein